MPQKPETPTYLPQSLSKDLNSDGRLSFPEFLAWHGAMFPDGIELGRGCIGSIGLGVQGFPRPPNYPSL